VDVINPPLAYLRFVVNDEDMFGEPNFIGHAIFPMNSLKTGRYSNGNVLKKVLRNWEIKFVGYRLFPCILLQMEIGILCGFLHIEAFYSFTVLQMSLKVTIIFPVLLLLSPKWDTWYWNIFFLVRVVASEIQATIRIGKKMSLHLYVHVCTNMKFMHVKMNQFQSKLNAGFSIWLCQGVCLSTGLLVPVIQVWWR